MLQAMFSGVSGLQVHQTKLDVIGNNIANVNTIGFKAGNVSFEDQLSQTLRASSSPTGTSGGQNPAQVGLGVQLGAVDTDQTQGNLESTGQLTDMAIQGNGFFMVGAGQNVSYTRDGSFNLDSDGVLVNPANGNELLGYVADASGNIDTTQPVSTTSILKIPIGLATSVKQTDASSFQGNLDAGAALVSTTTTYSGTVSADPTTISTTAYDANGNAHSVDLTLSGKVTNSSATPPTDTWNASLLIDGAAASTPITTVQFNSTTGAIISPSALVSENITGSNGAPNFSLNLDMSQLTDSGATTPPAAATDGQTGSSPTWNASLTVYDSLGRSHQVNMSFTRSLLDGSAPTGAVGEWNWTASENGKVVGTSNAGGSGTPLYFNDSGNLIDQAKQSITLNGAPAPISVDFSTLTQLAGTSSVASNTQDGFPVGTLQSFTISQAGLITGVFSNGQSRSLGQIAMASFANPAGLLQDGQNLFSESSNSGPAQVGVPGSQNRGNINTGYLEMSNVDLSTEFTDLIVTQRGFQANTKIISTVDELLQTVIAMKQ